MNRGTTGNLLGSGYCFRNGMKGMVLIYRYRELFKDDRHMARRIYEEEVLAD